MRKPLALAFGSVALVGGFLFASPAFADTRIDANIQADGTVLHSFGSYYTNWFTSTTTLRCGQGGSWTSGANIEPFYKITNTFNNCGPQVYALGSSTIKVRLGDATEYDDFYGIVGGNVWRRATVDDGDTTTHVIRINAPISGATTTSPVSINFDYYQGTPVYANGYELELKNTLTYQSKIVRGWLTSAGSGSWNEATTTTLPDNSGTWALTISLIDGSPDIPTAAVSYLDHSDIRYFGMGYNDNFQTVQFGPAYASYASTSCAITFSGGFSLSDCMGYLFIPSQNLTSTYGALATSLEGKFPFSYVFSISSTWQGLTASSTANSQTLEFKLHDLGIGSTSAMGNFLPNQTVFSASTTKQYFPSGVWDALRALVATAIILSLFADIFFTTRNMIKT